MKESPHRVWYVAYAFLWVPAGVACYLIWRNRDKGEAKKQLWHSAWIGAFVWLVVPSVLGMLSFPLGLVFG